jgi:hypothetical protein
VHRHVVRAILPKAWGQPGIIPATPTSGQQFTTTLTYTLPPGVVEGKVKLVAFVSRFSSNHEDDEVMNAAETKLVPAPSGIDPLTDLSILVWPNPIGHNATVVTSLPLKHATAELYNSVGDPVRNWSNLEGTRFTLSRAGLATGLYWLRLEEDGKVVAVKPVIVGY